MKKTYNEIVSIARECARDNVRLHLTNGVRGEILKNEVVINEVNAEIAEVKKNITRKEYKLSLVDAANPDAVEITKDLTEDIASLNKAIENLTKEMDSYTKKVELLKEDIVKIQSGEKKVSVETLQEMSCEYLTLINEKLMIEKALTDTITK